MVSLLNLELGVGLQIQRGEEACEWQGDSILDIFTSRNGGGKGDTILVVEKGEEGKGRMNPASGQLVVWMNRYSGAESGHSKVK